MKKAVQTTAAQTRDQREHKRITTTLPGRLFVPAEEADWPCEILNLSLGGAGVRCEEPPPLNSFVVLYVDGIGRYEAVATRYVEGELGLRFVCNDAQRQRLLEDLITFVSGGLTHDTRLRRHGRQASRSIGNLTLADGSSVPCDILDVSLQGLSLRTAYRPPIGEIVEFGHTQGRVIRHHADGVGIEFLIPSKNSAVQANGD